MILQNKKDLEKVKDFLRTRPGYLKEGGKRLRNVLLNKGLVTTVELCKQAVREINLELATEEIESSLADSIESPRILIYDIETSYAIVSSWRIGWDINLSHDDILEPKKIICVSYKWLDEDEIYNLTWDKNKDDKFLLEQFIPVLNEADLIVAHNGDRYDLKFIKTRAILQGLDMFVSYPQFDTLKVAKKKFMFDSNKLDSIGKDLGLGEKIKTDKKLWDDVILRQDKNALQKMIDYCNQDVLLLEKVYNKLSHWENPKYHHGVLNERSEVSSPVSGSLNIVAIKSTTSARGTIKHIMKDLDTDRYFEMSASNYEKFLKSKIS